MAAGEDHGELVVLEAGLCRLRGRSPGTFELPRDLRRFVAKESIPSDDVQGVISGRLIQPTRRIVRYTVIRPVPERLQQSFLDDVFDKIQVVEAENSRQRRDEMAVLMPEQVIDELPDIRRHTQCGFISRTSTRPLYFRCGQSFAVAIAASRPGSSIRKYPPITSFVSVNGPSTTRPSATETTRPPSLSSSPP